MVQPNPPLSTTSPGRGSVKLHKASNKPHRGGPSTAHRNRINMPSQDNAFVPSAAAITRLPNETVLDILEGLPGRSVINTMCANKSMHVIGARVLYTMVRVEGDSARLLCATLASRSVLSSLYASFTRKLSFSSHSRFDKFITYPMFCEALLCLQELRELSIYISAGDGEFMRSCMHRYGITRGHVDVIDADRLAHAEVLYTPPSLPALYAFRMGSEASLIDVTLYRSITDLTITSAMSRKDLESILVAIRHASCYATLSSLAIRLCTDVNSQSAIRAVSDSTSTLRVLTVEQPILNPINILNLLTSRRDILPNLRTMLLNRFATRSPNFYLRVMTPDAFERGVRQLLELLGNQKRPLSFVCMGPTMWTKFLDERSWSTDVPTDTARWWNSGLGRLEKCEVQRDPHPSFEATAWKAL